MKRKSGCFVRQKCNAYWFISPIASYRRVGQIILMIALRKYEYDFSISLLVNVVVSSISPILPSESSAVPLIPSEMDRSQVIFRYNHVYRPSQLSHSAILFNLNFAYSIGRQCPDLPSIKIFRHDPRVLVTRTSQY